MVYYHYIFYKTYKFCLRLGAHDMPGIKAILLTGFVALLNGFLLASMVATYAGYNLAHLLGLVAFRTLLVATQLGFWLLNYALFWRQGRLGEVLRQFEERTIAFNQLLASLVTAFFFLFPLFLLIVQAVRGAHLRG